MNTVTLNNGVVMPVLGLGVYQIDDASLCEQIVRDALRAGYRLIDTAAAYGNEEAVGRAVKRSGVPREDIFITTKVWVQDFGYEKTKRAVAASLEKLDMAYVDLVLLHQQLSDYYGSWRALQELCRQGTVRAIGVSNFYPDRLADLCENADILPAVNQIECHPFYQRAYDLDVMKKLRVAPMAWGPFAEGGHDIWNNPILKKIAAKHGKTVAQVALRFTLQRGVIVIPKTVHKDRLIENMAVWDFELDGEDMSQITALDTGRTEIIDHLTVDMVQFLNRHKIHE
ncbi:aldo/keto reductase [Megasphaera hexanoica]|uniref:aldo/keto reductase n=1 Tax=uncultured Megasphaera sp. TaxID=165188 RepID=UPI002599739D|nr:aldo/keto reductase [uncultured Megasphaera sp.]MDN0046495.1 aldo/keto reductase [Megasphaera hexanoica]